MMFFSRAALVAAWLLLVLGLAYIATGFAFAVSPMFHDFLPAETAGSLIDKGLVIVVGSLLLGTVAELSVRLRKDEGTAQ